MPRTELYVGNLGRDVSRKDIEDVFDKYGRLIRCDIKNRGFGPTYAFLEFDEERDAEDALRAENGKDMCGCSMIVEWAKAKENRERLNGRNSFRGSRGGYSSRSLECYECGERGHFARDCRNRRRGRSDHDRHRDRDSSRRRHSDRRERRRTRSSSYRRTRSRTRSRSRSRS